MIGWRMGGGKDWRRKDPEREPPFTCWLLVLFISNAAFLASFALIHCDDAGVKGQDPCTRLRLHCSEEDRHEN